MSTQMDFGRDTGADCGSVAVTRALSWKSVVLLAGLAAAAVLQGCVGFTAFPAKAEKGETMSVMVGGSDQARTSTVDVTLTDDASTVWDLQTLGLVRSVFNLRADSRAHGLHYSSNFFDVENTWNKGHEPVQTVLVFDIPTGAATGAATLTVNINATDDSSGVASPYTIPIEILAGTGTSSNFLRQDFTGTPQPVDFASLEAAPYAKVSFGKGGLGGNGGLIFGAATIVVDFDENIVSPGDLNVVSSISTTRGDAGNPTADFGDKQKMVMWKQDGDKLTIHVIAPQGIRSRYVQLYIVHPNTVVGDPAFSLFSSDFYDVNGNPVSYPAIPVLSYNP